jgi:rubrerythrin
MVMFHGSELLDIAVSIERNGIAFYDALSNLSSDRASREVFQNLSAMEIQHEQTFNEMLQGPKVYEPFEAYAEEYARLMTALAETAVFPTAQAAVEMANEAAGPVEALEIAIQAEKDSILFYNEMRRVTKPDQVSVVDQIVEEERSHLMQLRALGRDARQACL